MKTQKGWTGKRLRIDLSEGKFTKEDLPLDHLESWIGGRGLNGNVMVNETHPGLDPFHPDTTFCLAVGPLTGTCAPCTATVNAASRSPLLEPSTHATTSMGGHWGAELKFAGYDQIVIKGKANCPTYILIDDDEVQLRDAVPLWGKDTAQTTISIQEELKDRRFQVLCIGPAGERLVRYASLINSFLWDSGRLGHGAVLGSKNVKALAVRGSRSVNVADPERFASICQHTREKIQSNPLTQQLSSEGTLINLKNANWRSSKGKDESDWSPAEDINSQYYHNNYFFSKEGCFSCPINCGRYTYIKNGPLGGTHFGGVRGESILALGPEIGNIHWDSILKMIHLCLLSGIDPVSTGGIIAWAMNSYDRGLLTESDTDGIALHRGNVERAFELITKIVQRNGFGDILAEGALRASKIIGQGTEELVPHIKGLEITDLNSISLRTFLHLAVSTGDWDYLKCAVNMDGKESMKHISSNSGKTKTIPQFIKRIEDVKCAADLLGICSFPYARFPALDPSDMIEQLVAVSGLGMDANDLLNLSEKVIEVERTMAVKDGMDQQNEARIRSFLENEDLSPTEWESSLSEYYVLRKWEPETGFPTKLNS